MKLNNIKTFILLLMLSFLSFGTAFAQGSLQRDPKQPSRILDSSNTFTIVLEDSQDPLEFNPLLATDSNSLIILQSLYEGLYGYDRVQNAPVLAAAQSVDVSEDGLIWSFTIRKTLRFSNGETITAQTYVDSWLWLLSHNNNPASSFFDAVAGAKAYRLHKGSSQNVGIKALDDYHLEIRLHAPAPYLPDVLVLPYFAPMHSEQRQLQPSDDPLTIPVPGPFRVSALGSNTITLEKNPWYWDYDNVDSDFIRLIQGFPAEKLSMEYANGTIDWSAAFIPLQALSDKRDLRLAAQYATAFFYFSADSGPYANPKIRKALSLLIDWNSVRDESGQLFITDRLLPDLDKRQIDRSNGVDIQKAFELLREAGYENGKGLPAINIAIHRGTQVETAAHTIAEAWSSILQITVVLDIVPLGVYAATPSNSPYDFAFITWIGDIYDPYVFLYLWESQSSHNLGRLKDPVFDALLDDAMKESSKEKRLELYAIAEQRLLDEAVVFPMYHGISSNVVATDRVTGWNANILDIHPLKHLKSTKSVQP